MALPARVSSLDTMDEAFRSHYRPEGDGFILDVTAVAGWAMEDVGGLKSSLTAERGHRAEADKMLKPFKLEDGTYLDPLAAQEAFAKVTEYGKIDPNKEAGKMAAQQIEDAKKVMTADFLAKSNAWEAREAVLVKGATGAVIGTAIDIALSDPEVRGIPRALKPLLMPEIGWEENDGVFTTFVRDPQNPTRPKLNSQANPMSIKERALELKADPELAGLFEATKKSGSATSAVHSPGRTATTGTSPVEGATGSARVRNALNDPDQIAGAAGSHFVG